VILGKIQKGVNPYGMNSVTILGYRGYPGSAYGIREPGKLAGAATRLCAWDWP
jgi:hypothetical protein